MLHFRWPHTRLIVNLRRWQRQKRADMQSRESTLQSNGSKAPAEVSSTQPAVRTSIFKNTL